MPKNLISSVFGPIKAFAHPSFREYVGGNRLSYPVTYELGPSGPGNCNNRCSFCMHGNYYNVKSMMSLELYQKFIDEIKELSQERPTGMIYSASGESLTNPDIIEFIKYTNKKGIDQALITNGTSLGKKGIIEAILKDVSWTRISLDSGTPETRKKIHGVDDFEHVLENLTQLATKKREMRSSTHIGAQIVVTPVNYLEIIEATHKVSLTGIDYFQIKPVVYHPMDHKPQESKELWEKVIKLSESARDMYERPKDHESGRFDVWIKYDQFEAIMKPDHDKNAYGVCRAIFYPIIEANGDVFHCSQTRGMSEFNIGNINEQSFEEIWHSRKRKETLKNIDIMKCQPVCRCHWMNKLLDSVMNEKKLKETKMSFQ